MSGLHPHMIIAWGNVRRVGDHGRTVVRFHHAQRTHRIESLCETASEPGRHVLHDEDGGATAGRKTRHEIGKRARPTR